jgi:hypothetical protein
MTVVETHQNLEINEARIVWAQTNNQHSNFGSKLKLAASKPNKWRNDLLANESKHYTLTYIANGSIALQDTHHLNFTVNQSATTHS